MTSLPISFAVLRQSIRSNPLAIRCVSSLSTQARHVSSTTLVNSRFCRTQAHATRCSCQACRAYAKFGIRSLHTSRLVLGENKDAPKKRKSKSVADVLSGHTVEAEPKHVPLRESVYEEVTDASDASTPKVEKIKTVEDAVSAVRSMCVGGNWEPASFHEKWFSTPMVFMQAGYLAPNTFKKKNFKEEFCEGAGLATQYFASCFAHKDCNALVHCVEDRLFRKVEAELTLLREQGYEIVFDIKKVLHANINKSRMIAGLMRGEKQNDRIFATLVGQHFFLTQEEFDDLSKSNFIKKGEIMVGLFSRGCYVQIDSLVKVRQAFYIKDKEGKVVSGTESEREVVHLCTFESALEDFNPNLTYEPSNKPHEDPGQGTLKNSMMTASEWILADINLSVEGNFPILLDRGSKPRNMPSRFG